MRIQTRGLWGLVFEDSFFDRRSKDLHGPRPLRLKRMIWKKFPWVRVVLSLHRCTVCPFPRFWSILIMGSWRVILPVLHSTWGCLESCFLSMYFVNLIIGAWSVDLVVSFLKDNHCHHFKEPKEDCSSRWLLHIVPNGVGQIYLQTNSKKEIKEEKRNLDKEKKRYLWILLKFGYNGTRLPVDLGLNIQLQRSLISLVQSLLKVQLETTSSSILVLCLL